MKKIFYIILIYTAVISACDPIEERDTLSGAIGVSDLDISATPVAVNGLNSNEIVVENNSPILSRWISERNQISEAYGTVYFDYIGNYDVGFIGLNGDGSKIETTVPVSIDTITSIKSEFVDRLGIKYNADGSPDQTSLPYYFGMASNAEIEASISVVQQTENGNGGNLLTVTCSSPVLSDWNWDGAVSNKNTADIFVTTLGSKTLNFTGTRADGSTVNLQFGPFEVEVLTYIPNELIYLFGDFITDPNVTKTWEWYTSDDPAAKVWANGPRHEVKDPSEGWWQNSLADMEGREIGSMTFSFTDGTLVKEVTGPADVAGTTTGTVEVDLAGRIEGWSVGKMNLDGVSVLFGYDPNNGNAPFTELQIVSITEDVLIVAGSNAGESWIYKFKAVE